MENVHIHLSKILFIIIIFCLFHQTCTLLIKIFKYINVNVIYTFTINILYYIKNYFDGVSYGFRINKFCKLISLLVRYLHMQITILENNL